LTEILRFKDRESLEKESADILARKIKYLLNIQDQVVLAIPGGRSVSGTFSRLKNEDLDWSKVHIFMVDERLVTADDPEYNFNLAKEGFVDSLLKEGKLTEDNLHPFIMDSTKQDKGIVHYQQELKDLGGRYDVVVLSSGEDGHFGALAPNHHSIRDDAEYFLTMTDSPKPPSERMTMSRTLFLKSAFVLLIFLGEGKKEALRRFQIKDDYEDCPCRLVHQIKDSAAVTDQ